jgi:hypothetical protein
MKALRPLVLAAIALSLPLAATADDAKPAITVTPYGILHFGTYWTGGYLTTQDYPAQSPLTGPGIKVTAPSNGSFIQSARASRVGLRAAIDDGNWTGATLSGLIEFDFAGGNFPGTQTVTCTAPVAPATANTCTLNSPAASSASNVWYNGLMRLRFASLTATWKTPVGNLSVLAGQDWGLFNGLFAESLAYYSTPLFHTAGNAWRRGPQVRATYAGNFDKVALSVAVDAITPISNTGPVDDGSGNLSRTPDIEGRLGVTVKATTDVSVMVAGSYATGKRRFNWLTAYQKDVTVSAMGAEVDANLTNYLQVKGEYYSGKGMDDAYAGIAPAGVAGTTAPVAPSTTAPLYMPYRGTGFWAQAILKPIPQVWITGGMGQEQVDKDDLVTAKAAASTRSKNQLVNAGLLFNAGKNWRFGLEYSMDTSTYGDFGTAPKEERKANQIALSSWCRF